MKLLSPFFRVNFPQLTICTVYMGLNGVR